MPAESAGTDDMHAGATASGDVVASAAARAAATAAAFAAAAESRKKRDRSGSGSTATNGAEKKKLREDGSSQEASSPEEEPRVLGEDRSDRGEGDPEAMDDCDQGAWTRLPTADEKAQFQATRKAERAVRRHNHSAGPASSGFEVDFVLADEKRRFGTENLLRIFCDVRQVVRDAQPRLNAKGGITVRVPQQAQIEQLKTITCIAGAEVKLNLPSAASLWGRVTGVHPMFSELDLLEALKDQGVAEVSREKYSTCESSSASENKRVQKPSNRIRIRFEGDLKPEITIAHQVYKVTLCPASPLQCLSCCGFGHRAALCPQRSAPRCRKCGSSGHQLWQCTSKAKCSNCKGPHASNDSRCPVYAVYAKAAQERFVGKVVAGLDNVSIKQSAHFVEGQAPASAVPADGVAPTFAAVVGKPAMVALVQTTEKGDRVVCYLPKLPPKIQPVVKPLKAKEVTSPSSNPSSAASSAALIETITAKVMEKVTKSLDEIISSCIAATLEKAIPKIVEAVAALLRKSSVDGSPVAIESLPRPQHQ